MAEIPTFKCVLLGESGVGKTTYLHRLLTGEFLNNHEPTLGVEVHPLVFKTNKGEIRFNIWDTAGQEQYGGLVAGYYVEAKCAIIMFDTTVKETYENVPKWQERIKESAGDIPVVLCGNKVDLKKPFRSGENYLSISAKSNFQFETPFLSLARTLMHEPVLNFLP